MKIDKTTAALIATLVTAFLGGAEMRLAVSRIDDRVQRIDERVQRVERELAPPPHTYASNEGDDR